MIDKLATRKDTAMRVELMCGARRVVEVQEYKDLPALELLAIAVDMIE